MLRWLGLSREPDETAPEDERLTFSEALMLERPSDVLWRWGREGRLRTLVPDLDALIGVSQRTAHRDDAFSHTLKVIDASDRTPVRRWSAALHDIGKGPTYIETPEGRSRFFEHDKVGAEMVPDIMQACGESEPLISHVRQLVELHMRPISYRPEWTDAAVKRLYEEATEGRGQEGWDDLLALSRADLRGYLPEPIDRGLWVIDQLERRWGQIRDTEIGAEQAAEAQRLPVDGADLLLLTGREPGPWVGELKAHIQQLVDSGHLERDDREGALSAARLWLSEHPAR